jgi:hypothetical protein
VTLERNIELWTDFHSPKKNGAHVSTVGVGGGTLFRPEVGEEVTLFDGEGNTCLGVVEAVFDVTGYVLVHTRADPTTWRTESPVADLMAALRGYIEEDKPKRAKRRPVQVETETKEAEETTLSYPV